MGNFRILDAAHPLDRALWQARLAELPADHRDLHYEPGYVAAYAAEANAQALCALYDHEEGFEIYPFILKAGPPKEMACAYGYGGPIIKGPAQVWDGLDRWLTRNGVQREFYRPHPFIHKCSVFGEKEIVYMDLDLHPESQLRKGHKSSLVKARKSALTIESSSDFCLFRDMYACIMHERKANERWRFSEKLLPALNTAYPDGFKFLLARVDGEAEAGCILLGAHRTCYYHYAGSYGRYRNLGVGQALVVEAAWRARGMGCRRLHLGGGTTANPNDPLFIFKSGFSKRRAWVYKYEREFKTEEMA